MVRSLCSLVVLLSTVALAEEGMWTFDAFPSAAVKKAHGFAPDAKWLDRVRLGSLKLGNGCSASFVSPDGLVLTNHHCARSCIEDVTGAKEDLVTNGFSAAALNDERRCPKLEVLQLVSMTDVTRRMNEATRNLTGEAFHRAQLSEKSDLETACITGPDVHCDVVTFFQGARYQLYKYARHADVRLVFAPESDSAAFGGFPDNFNFPRFAYDMALMRVWSGEKPLPDAPHLRFAKKSPAEDALVFVSGHPGATERQSTVAQLEFARDVELPWVMAMSSELRGRLQRWSETSPEAQRAAQARLRGIENGLKVYRGRQQALADPKLLGDKRAAEAALRASVFANSNLRRTTERSWDETARALGTLREMYPQYRLVEVGDGFNSKLFTLARQMLRMSEELGKPSGERLREYSDGRLPALRTALLRDAPIDVGLEIETLGFGLTQLQELLGADHPLVLKVLRKESPRAMAARIVKASKLGDAKVREALIAKGRSAMVASKDPVMVLAKLVDAEARALRRRYEDDVEAVIERNGEAIGRSAATVRGTSGYPDATGTLRLSYGTVKGWTQDGRKIGPFTTTGVAYARNTGAEPFVLPRSWLRAKGAMPKEVVFNMTSTHDIIGGNSGSPVVDTEGDIVGLAFDGNLPSIGGRYAYDPVLNRTISVHAEVILTALDVVYRANRITQEIRKAQ